MQDIQATGGGGGRFFGGGGDRRLRPHHHQNHQALKCPRCDSLNTKFCYYNNYNLSQPRHFCKSCRRYWTKGGVLRNVPVGGGCRKSKRSLKPKVAAASASSDGLRNRKSNSRSSSESSSLTASTTAAATAAATPELACTSSSNSASAFMNFPISTFFGFLHSTNPSLDQTLIDQALDCKIFPDVGGFTSLMTSSSDPPLLGFNVADFPANRLHYQDNGSVLQNRNCNEQWQEEQKMVSPLADELKMPEITAGYMDRTVQNNLPGLQDRTDNGALGTLHWQAGGDQGLFDLAGTVDQAYWSQTYWPDTPDHSYLP